MAYCWKCASCGRDSCTELLPTEVMRENEDCPYYILKESRI